MHFLKLCYRNRGWPKSSLFNSYYTEVLGRGLLLSLKLYINHYYHYYCPGKSLHGVIDWVPAVKWVKSLWYNEWESLWHHGWQALRYNRLSPCGIMGGSPHNGWEALRYNGWESLWHNGLSPCGIMGGSPCGIIGGSPWGIMATPVA